MIFFHKFYYNPNYTNFNKKKFLVIYALNPKNYTKYTNYIMQNKKLKKTLKQKIEQNFKAFKL
jgi:hypothetical protein